jgi:hypothetical protein
VNHDDWKALVLRIDGWWGPPNMTETAKGAWFDALGEYPAADVRNALFELARKEVRRPAVALIVQTIGGQVAGHSERRSAPPDKDPVGLRPDGSWDAVQAAQQHAFVLAQLRRVQDPEHRRRHEVVTAAGRRFSMAELQTLMSRRSCSAEEFDARLQALMRASR